MHGPHDGQCLDCRKPLWLLAADCGSRRGLRGAKVGQQYRRLQGLHRPEAREGVWIFT